MSGSVVYSSSCPVVFSEGRAVDMHVHTNYSDGLIRVPDLFAYLKRRNLSVAVTDHNTIAGVEEAYTYPEAAERIIPGIEVSSSDGPHILVYFDRLSDLRTYYASFVDGHQGACPHMATGLSTEQIVRDAAGAGGLVIAAHPYGYAMLIRGVMKAVDAGLVSPAVLEYVDGLEVLCGGLSHTLNLRAEAYATEHGLCMTGGSDAHTLREIGRAVTIASDADSVPAFLELLRQRKTHVVGCERNPGENILMGSWVMSRYIPYVGSGLKVHLVQNLDRLKKKL